MSTENAPPSPPPGPPPAPPRRGCLTAIMAIAGIIMLLPGLCALLVGGGSLYTDGRVEPWIASLVFLGLALGACGIVLIWAAIRGRRA